MDHVKGPLEDRFGQKYPVEHYKNASDARILLEAGRLCDTSTVIIVSNDKIFEEVVDLSDGVHQLP